MKQLFDHLKIAQIILYAAPWVMPSALVAQTDSLIHSGYHIDRGKVLVDSGQFEKAIQEFKFIDPRDTSYTYSLAELADAYLKNKQYQEAIVACQSGLQKPSSYRSKFLLTQAMVFVEQGAFDKAAELFQLGQKEYPFYTGFLIQHGKMLYNQNQYDDAEKLFLKAIETSPFVSTPHLHLGIISMLRGEKVRGMMAMGIYLALNNQANRQLGILERFVKNELTDEFNASPTANNSFARLDEIIRSRIAMEEEYKVRIPINVGIVRQYQLLFDQLALSARSNNDPWRALYYPIYESVVKANLQDAFVYHILASSSIETVPQWAKKNEKQLSRFYDVVNTALKQLRQTRVLESTFGYDGPVTCWYATNHYLEAIGNKDNVDRRTGRWYYYADNGARLAEGNYRDGKKVGMWKYYNDSGITTSTENHDTGEEVIFNEQGRLRQQYTLKEKKTDGTVLNYYPCGTVRQQLQFRDGDRHGPCVAYAIDGTVSERFFYDRDSLQGKYLRYYDHGLVSEESEYSRNQLNGKFTRYYRSGKTASQGTYVNGKGEGTWTLYYDNGQISEIGQYKNDLPAGEFNYFTRDGMLSEKRLYNDEGQYHGENTHYQDSKPHYQLLFKNDLVIGVKHFDKQGKVTDSVGMRRGRFMVGAISRLGKQGPSFNMRKEWRSVFGNIILEPGIWSRSMPMPMADCMVGR